MDEQRLTIRELTERMRRTTDSREALRISIEMQKVAHRIREERSRPREQTAQTRQ